MKSIITLLRKLTYDDLDEWAGDTILNRGKNYVKNVSQLSRLGSTELAAWVKGSEQYATRVSMSENSELESWCSCPYSLGSPCKHTVAVVLTAADKVKKKTRLPQLKDNDKLCIAVTVDDQEDEEDEWEGAHSQVPAAIRRTKAQARIENIINEKDTQELKDLLLAQSRRFLDVRQYITEVEQLAKGQIAKRSRALRAEIKSLTSEPGWSNHWSGESYLPDFTRVQDQLQSLADQGYADEVLQLGQYLWSRGNAQVKQTGDEGETVQEIANCLDVVIAVLPQTSLSRVEQLMWLIDHLLVDEYALLDSADKLLKRRIYTKAHWQEVATLLEKRLQVMPKKPKSDYTDRYHRERVLEQLLQAYSRAGWKDRVIPRLEEEANACQCYTHLVDALLEAKELERARHWCKLGYEQTLDDAPGIASALQKKLRDLAQKLRQFGMVAAYRAQDFFERPNLTSYQELEKAAKKAKCWPVVRAAALAFLRTGKTPTGNNQKRKNTSWPLPDPEVQPSPSRKIRRSQRFPNIETLIRIAIMEKRTDDIVSIYHQLSKTKRWGWEIDKEVASTLVKTHPDLALNIWQFIAESLIDRVKPSAYVEAAIYLRLMKKTYTQNRRQQEWQMLLNNLRTKHKAKRRLMGVLDTLSKPRE